MYWIRSMYSLAILLGLSLPVFAQRQKTELKLNVYSGFSSYCGSGAMTKAPISIVGPTDGTGLYPWYRYGRNSGVAYAVEVLAQRVTARNQLIGVALGFERLQSKGAFDSVYIQRGVLRTTGTVLFNNYNATISPYIGQRFAVKNIAVDVTAGLDVAVSTVMRAETKGGFEKGYSYNNSYNEHPVDLRPRLQVAASYKKIGLAAGYSVGTRNLYNASGLYHFEEKAYSNFLRFGISYKFR